MFEIVDGLKFEIVSIRSAVLIENMTSTSKLKVPPDVHGIPVTAIKAKVFAGNQYLQEIVLPASIKDIGESAFHGCTNLKVVRFYSTIFKQPTCNLAQYVFKDCRNLVVVHFTGKVLLNGMGVFENCISLSAVDGMFNSLLGFTFHDCKALNDLEFFGKSFISSTAFIGCHSLENLTFKGDLSPKTAETTIALLKEKNIKCYANSVFADWAYEGAAIEIMPEEDEYLKLPF